MPRGAPLTQEQKDKMAAGRRRKRLETQAARPSTLAQRLALPPERAGEPDEYVPAIEQPGPAEESDEPFERFDDETEALIAEGLITREEVWQLRVDAKAKVTAERRAATRKEVLGRLVERERSDAGLIAPKDAHRKWLDELVDMQITLPMLKSPNSNVINHPEPIRIDGHVFANGRSYTVTRAQALTLLDMMGQARKHHAQTLGESPAYYDQNRGAFSYMGGVPRGMAGRGLSSPIMERRGAA